MASPAGMTALFARLILGGGSRALAGKISSHCMVPAATTYRLPTRSAILSSSSSPFTVQQNQQCSPFHTTTALGKGGRGVGGGKKRKGPKRDPRIRNLKKSMPRSVPAPLRFGRNRALRHWTIHRAWLLFQRKEREARERELMRMTQSMSNACEELRKTAGPGTREEGYLYRVSQEKKGVYAIGGIPIEYTRFQTETPPRGEAWNHDWKP